MEICVLIKNLFKLFNTILFEFLLLERMEIGKSVNTFKLSNVFDRMKIYSTPKINPRYYLRTDQENHF